LATIVVYFKDHHPDALETVLDVERLVLPINIDFFLEFLGYIKEIDADLINEISIELRRGDIGEEEEDDDADDNDDDDDGRRDNNRKQKSASTMGGYRSALSFEYVKRNMAFSTELMAELKKFMMGYRRKIAELKHGGFMSKLEGKQALTFVGYQTVAKKCVAIRPDGGSRSWGMMSFCWAFFTCCWNLMARSISVGSLMIPHISWVNDAMVINIAKHKGDQEGNDCTGKHVYANPLMPHVRHYSIY